MTIGEKIRHERKKLGLSQEELAGELSVSRQTLSKWEAGIALPDTENVLKLCGYFNISADYLLKDDISDIAPAVTPPASEKFRLTQKAAEIIDSRGYIGAYIMAARCAVGLLAVAFMGYAYLSVYLSLAPLTDWMKVPQALILPAVVGIAALVLLIQAVVYTIIGCKLKKLQRGEKK